MFLYGTPSAVAARRLINSVIYSLDTAALLLCLMRLVLLSLRSVYRCIRKSMYLTVGKLFFNFLVKPAFSR